MTNFFPSAGPQLETSTTSDTVTALGFANTSCITQEVHASDSATATVVPSFIKCDVSFSRGGVALNTSSAGCDVSAAISADPIDVTVTITGTNNQQNLSGCQVVLSGVPGAPLTHTAVGPINGNSSVSTTFTAVWPATPLRLRDRKCRLPFKGTRRTESPV